MKTLKTLINTLRALPVAALVAATAAVPVACNENSNIGGELVGDQISIVVDSSFTLSGHSIETGAVLSRTVVQLLGNIDAPDYGYIHSDFVTQFMPASAIDTTGVTEATLDSIKLFMLVNNTSYTGDPMAPMGLEVFPLTKQLESPIYSNFNPAGYYDPAKRLGSLVYNLSKTTEDESLQSNDYFTLAVDLPLELAHTFYREYKTNPATFSSPLQFAKFFPGLYIANSYGAGRITRIGSTTMRIFYHQNIKNEEGRDTTLYQEGVYFAVTPEIITNNDISLAIAPEVRKRVDKGDAILLAPAGLDVELKFPAREIIDSYKRGTANALGIVNKLSFTLPVESIENKYDIGAPADVLLVLKKDRESFFLNNQLPDGKTSFRATLTNTDSGQVYPFTDMRQYILNLMDQEAITDEDITFVLVPVLATSETQNDYYNGSTTVLTAITPYVAEPRMTQIMLDKAKINFVYSRQSTNF